jgi:anti-sigma regulatory factor (Ser/Thr protein kinase)
MNSSLSIAAELRNLKAIRQFITETGANLGASQDAINPLIQAVDESVTNIIVHGYRGEAGQIDIHMGRERDVLVIRLRDQARHFDPTQIPPCDVTEPLEKRSSGGLGMHMIRHFADKVTYRITPEGENELTLRKRIG